METPNIIIANAAGFTFVDFLTHLAPIVAAAWLAALIYLRFAFRKQLAQSPRNVAALQQLNEREVLRDPAATRRILIVLVGVVAGFLLQPVLGLSPTYFALVGAVVALFWCKADVEETLRRVDWDVLIFFVALFVVMGGLESTNVFSALIGKIENLPTQYPLGAGLGLLWFAALVSAVVANVPFTIAMVPVIKQFAILGVPTSFLWWALALGTGFGGNGTLIGSTANVVAVSISEKTSTPITSRTWMKSGLPVMIITCIIASILYAIFFSWMNTP